MLRAIDLARRHLDATPIGTDRANIEGVGAERAGDCSVLSLVPTLATALTILYHVSGLPHLYDLSLDPSSSMVFRVQRT